MLRKDNAKLAATKANNPLLSVHKELHNAPAATHIIVCPRRFFSDHFAKSMN